MAHTSLKTRAIFTIAAIAFLFVLSPDLNAQNYKRSSIIEEVTGTWCQHCPPGAWALDTLQEEFGDNLVILAWHGPVSYGEPMALKAGDSVAAAFGINSYPTALFTRYYEGGFGIMPTTNVCVWITEANYPGTIENVLNAKPTVDFRLVNAAYNPGTKMVSFDLDITPFDMSKMRSDDTTTYASVAVLAEDNIVAAQENSGDWNVVPAGTIDDFHHMNVVRVVGGSALNGDKFTLGTKTPAEALPIRRHYSMKVQSAWNAANIRAKAFIQAEYPKVVKNIDVLEAKQTGYATTLPATAPDAAWVVLPNVDSKISAATASIVWAKGGNVSAVKIEYSTNGGNTWVAIAGATNVSTSPYIWTHGFTSDATVQVRVTDAANPNTHGTSDAFLISPIKGSYTVTQPKAGAIIAGGTANYQIKYTAVNAGTQKTFSFSSDGGTTWSPITGTAGNNIFTWASVPNVATTQGMIKISDELAVEGMSGMFTITAKPGGSINSLTLGGVTNNKIIGGSQMDITWLSTGDIGSGFTIEYSLDGQATWNAIKSVPATTYEAMWTTPNGDYPNSFIRVRSADADKSAIVAMSNKFAITSTAGVFSPNALNGYSISNYPNPFAGSTTIKFTLPVSASVTVNVLDNLGRIVDHQVTKTLEAGEHTIPFNAGDLSNGVYTYTFEANGVKLAGKMSIVK